jgi:fermentation-respiration switch protein FrsA (DUF1100 family)
LRTGLLRRARRLVLALLGLAAVGYVAIVVYLLANENEMVYQPTPASVSWRDPAGSGVQDVELTTPAGAHIHAWWCPAKASLSALLYCHGNGGNLSHWADHIEMIRRELDMSVLIFDYPGYGKSPGQVSESACYDAADGAFDWLTSQGGIAPQRIIIYGGSLGSGVAVDLAARRPHQALLLASPFTSLPEVGQAAYPWLPIRMLMRNRFDNLEKIPRCGGGVIITHGMADTLIPFEHGEALFAAAAEPKQFLPVPGAGHIDPPAEFFRQARKFLETTLRRRAASPEERLH